MLLSGFNLLYTVPRVWIQAQLDAIDFLSNNSSELKFEAYVLLALMIRSMVRPLGIVRAWRLVRLPVM